MPAGSSHANAGAFERLARETARDLHAYLRRLLRYDGDVEDIAQESLLRIWSRRENLQVDATRPLLFRIAGNLAIDRLRERRRWKIAQMDDSLADGRQASPEPVIAGRQELARVRQAIGDLPLECRTAFVLARIEGKSHAEISSIMGVSCSMVEKHVAEALYRLSKARLQP